MLKKILIGICAFLVICAGGLYYLMNDGPEQVAAEQQTTQQAAPNLTLTALDGSKVELTSFKGKPLFLNFWATWCPPCVAEMPYINELYPEYKDKINFALVSIEAATDQPKVENFIKEKGMQVPIYMGDNNAISQAYKVQGIPTTVIISATGKITKVHVGGMTKDALRKILDEAIKK